jgi:hypothetical protein
MNPYRERISAPGVRDNDWAHTPYDDMRFAASAAGRGNREPGSSLRGVDDDVDDARVHDEATGTPSRRSGTAAARRAPGPRVLSAAKLAGGEVRDPGGERVGSIDAIMIDVPSGRVAYAVVASGGMLGLGVRRFAIPWKALRFDADADAFVLESANGRLDGAPSFDDEHWPSMTDDRWAREVHAYYGTTPYWE